MIRRAELKDMHRVYELVCMGIEELENGFHDIEHDKLMAVLLGSFDVAPCFVVEKNGEIVGCASLDNKTLPWSSKRLLTSNMVYVLPKFRSFGIIKELYKQINDTAKLLGVHYVDNFMGSDKIDARAKLAQSNDLKVIGLVIGGQNV